MFRVSARHRLLRPLGGVTPTGVRRRNLHVNSDSCGLPRKPTWSVHELLSSYPKPALSSATLMRLHNLSALIPPLEGTLEHGILKREMEEFIKLIEAVKLVDTRGIHLTGHLSKEDEGRQNPIRGSSSTVEQKVVGRSLLKYASRTLDGFYVVDSEKRRL